METFLAWQAEDFTTEEVAELGREVSNARGIQSPLPFFYAALSLAEREEFLAEATALVEKGFSNLPDSGPPVALALSARGFVLFRNNRIERAEVDLLRAEDVDPSDALVLHNLGRFYKHKADLIRTGWIGRGLDYGDLWILAEEYHARGMSGAWDRPSVNPNEEALRDMYDRVYGTQEGFEDHLEELTNDNPETRRTEILGDRVPEAEPLIPFQLLNLDGETVTSEALVGRVVVLKFWGTWCSPCVAELPQFQRLHERYGDSPDVLILSVCEDEGPEEVRRWMVERGYDFPVLMNTDFAEEVGIQGWPTTLFLDRGGHLAFEKVGASHTLLRDYTWRVEALR